MTLDIEFAEIVGLLWFILILGTTILKHAFVALS